MGKPHPQIGKLIESVTNKEPESSDAKIVRMEFNLEGVKRKNRYLKMDRRIKRDSET